MVIFVEKMNRYNEIGQCQVLHGTFIDFVRLKALQIWYTNINKSLLKSFIKLWSVCSANCFHLKWKWYYWLICNGIHFHYRWYLYMIFQWIVNYATNFRYSKIRNTSYKLHKCGFLILKCDLLGKTFWYRMIRLKAEGYNATICIRCLYVNTVCIRKIGFLVLQSINHATSNLILYSFYILLICFSPSF